MVQRRLGDGRVAPLGQLGQGVLRVGQAEGAGTLITLPDKLREVAALRLAHPEDTLAQLAQRCDPPITKSALNHRLRKLVELGKPD